MRHLRLLAAAAALAVNALVPTVVYGQSGAVAQPGAGGRGGAGAGPAEVAGSPGASPAKSLGTSTPPPLDPNRRIYEVDCTRPFDATGKGNLRCI